MNIIEYSNFSVRTINSNITVDNFYKQNYSVYSVDNEFMFTIFPTFVSMNMAKRLCSGNEEECIAAIKTYLESMKYHMDSIDKYIPIMQDK